MSGRRRPRPRAPPGHAGACARDLRRTAARAGSWARTRRALPCGAVRPRGSAVRPRESAVRPRESAIRPRESAIRLPGSAVRPRGSAIRPPGSAIRLRGTAVLLPASAARPRRCVAYLLRGAACRLATVVHLPRSGPRPPDATRFRAAFPHRVRWPARAPGPAMTCGAHGAARRRLTPARAASPPRPRPGASRAAAGPLRASPRGAGRHQRRLCGPSRHPGPRRGGPVSPGRGS